MDKKLGFQCFIFVTNDKIKSTSLISIGNEFQITEPKYRKKFLPLQTEFIKVLQVSLTS